MPDNPRQLDYSNPETPESIRQDFSEGWVKGLIVVSLALALLVMLLVWFSSISRG